MRMNFLTISQKKMVASYYHRRKKSDKNGVSVRPVSIREEKTEMDGHEKDIVQQQRYLPHDLITQNILMRLPIEPIVRFKSVSKQWYSTLASPHFAQTHFKFPRPSSSESILIRSYDEFLYLSYENGEADFVKLQIDFDVGKENLVLVGSCNGLVCLGSTTGCLFILWNPITGEFHKYLDHEISNDSWGPFFCSTWGFGYVSAIDDYKVVRICQSVFGSNSRVHVFSTRRDNWTRIDDDSSHNFADLGTHESIERPGVLLNETLYWMSGVPTLKLGERDIFSFDLALGLFDTFPHLDVSTPSYWEWSTDDYERSDEFLCVIKGCLSLYGTLVKTGEPIVTILKHPEETEQLSVDIDVVDSQQCENLIGLTTRDSFFTQHFGTDVVRLGIVDPSSQPMKHTTLVTFERGSEIEISSYSATLISPPVVTV